MESYFNNKGMFKLLLKWKYHILVLLVISIIASVVFSSSAFIKPKFKSEAILYPVNLREYSEESLSEQMQQILMSQDVQDYTINKLDLIEHYKIDTNAQYYISALNYEYASNIKIKKTEFESIQISVLDIDPNMACDIVKTIIEAYNYKIGTMHKTKYLEVVHIKTDELKKKQKEIDEIVSNLKAEGKSIEDINYNIKIEDINTSDAIGDIQVVTNKDNENASLNEIKYIYENIAFAKLKKELDEAIEGSEKNILYYQLISTPYPADKKHYPVRWVIVLMSLLGTLFMSLIIISIIESIKKANKT